jgi:dihydrofolate reductase
MRRIRYSVAMSLDGYIAGPNGEFDWIDMDPSGAAEYFKAFYAQFDTALMGRKSYELAKGPVSPLTTYVVSRSLRPGKLRGVTVLGEDALERIAELREQPGKDIWLWGGGELFGSLAEAGLVDTVEVGVIPVLLGAGRKVMAGCEQRVKLVPRPGGLELPGHTLLTYDVQKVRTKRKRAARER